MNKRNKVALTPPHDVDVNAALICGDAFFRLAQPFIDSVPKDFQAAQQFAVNNLGDLCAAAVNLALAVEIYLKALITRQGKSFPNEHTLPMLFEELPANVRDEIRTLYDKATSYQTADDPNTAGLIVEVVRRGSDRPTHRLKPFPKGFKALLQRNARNFVVWRYMFASETKIGQPLHFEFSNMVIGARILRNRFPAPPP